MNGLWGEPLAATGLALAIIGCGAAAPPAPSEPSNAFEVRKLPAAIEPYVRPVVEANTRFALDLYANLRSRPGNLFFSPFSTSIALAMTQAGAAGATRAEMDQVLHFANLEELPSAQGAVIESLDRGANLGGYRLSIANRVWGQSGANIREPYLEIMRRDYHAPFDQLDFMHASEEARETINGWVEEQTEHRIKDLFARSTIHQRTRLVLANAVYFKGRWASQFNPSRTQPAEFAITVSETVEVPLMSQTGKFKFSRESWGSVLEMPYAGADLSMVILLPSETEGLQALESELTLANLNLWLSHLSEEEVHVGLPRFRLETEYTLNPSLEQLGMRAAFTPSADFSNITDEPDWFLDIVVHKAFCEVNEEGTEAAAATGVGFAVTSAPPSFVADHPFAFLIRDHVTGTVLFLGRVMDPRS
jgi:serpin B